MRKSAASRTEHGCFPTCRECRKRIARKRYQADRAAAGDITSVYVYRDTEGRVLYVGITSRGNKRLREHAEDKRWFRFATTCELEHFTDRVEAEVRERLLIGHFSPPYNTTFKVST